VWHTYISHSLTHWLTDSLTEWSIDPSITYSTRRLRGIFYKKITQKWMRGRKKNRQSMTACSLLRLCYDSFTFTPHRQKSRTFRISSPLKIVSCILYYTPEQYTIKIVNIAAIRILIYFSRQLNLHSTPGLALSIEISCSSKLTFLKKIFCHPKILVFR